MTKTFPLIFAVAALVLAFPCGAAGSAAPQSSLVSQASASVDIWATYGGRQGYHRDAAVPGGDIVRVETRPAATSKPWDSGANVPLPFALRRGEPVSAVFWARAEAAGSVPVSFASATPPYAGFAATAVALTPSWQRFVVTGTAPADLAANSYNLALHLGLAPGAVSLGPVLWMRGKPDEARIAAQTQAYARTSGRVEDVRIPLPQGATLEGTLRKPHGSGPFPLLVCFPGTGPSARGAFRNVAERALVAGIAEFEYDKRGIGKSTGTFDDSFPPIIADGAAVLAAMKNRPDIDRARIAVCGLSQGGGVGPALAAADPSIAAVVMFAGPVGPRGIVILDGLRAKLQVHMSPATVDRIVEKTRAWMDARSAKAPAERIAALRAATVTAFASEGITRNQAEGMVAVLDTPLLLSMYDIDLAGNLSRVKAPVLAFYGEKDDVVDTAVTMPAARAALRDNPDATVVEIPNATHAFRNADHPEGWPVSIPQVLDLTIDWLVAHLHPARGAAGM